MGSPASRRSTPASSTQLCKCVYPFPRLMRLVVGCRRCSQRHRRCSSKAWASLPTQLLLPAVCRPLCSQALVEGAVRLRGAAAAAACREGHKGERHVQKKAVGALVLLHVLV